MISMIHYYRSNNISLIYVFSMLFSCISTSFEPLKLTSTGIFNTGQTDYAQTVEEWLGVLTNQSTRRQELRSAEFGERFGDSSVFLLVALKMCGVHAETTTILCNCSIVFLKMRWICLLFECLVLSGIGVQPLYLFIKTGEWWIMISRSWKTDVFLMFDAWCFFGKNQTLRREFSWSWGCLFWGEGVIIWEVNVWTQRTKNQTKIRFVNMVIAYLPFLNNHGSCQKWVYLQ